MRDVRVDWQINAHLGEFLGVVALEIGDGLADQAHVEVEADGRDVARLLTAQQVARATDLEVLHRDRDA